MELITMKELNTPDRKFDGLAIVAEAKEVGAELIEVRRHGKSVILCTKAFCDRCQDASAQLMVTYVGPVVPHITGLDKDFTLEPNKNSTFEFRITNVSTAAWAMELLAEAERASASGEFPKTVLLGYK